MVGPNGLRSTTVREAVAAGTDRRVGLAGEAADFGADGTG